MSSKSLRTNRQSSKLSRQTIPTTQASHNNDLEPHSVLCPGTWLYSRHRLGLFRWRLRSGDCSPWTNQPAFSDAWRSCDPSNTNKIGRTEFPYIRTLPDPLKHFATSREHFRKELKTYLFRKVYAPACENYWSVNLLTFLLSTASPWTADLKKRTTRNCCCLHTEISEMSRG